MTFIEQSDKIELEKILKNSLTKEKGEELMPSIAQVWKEEGIQIGLQDGIKIGEAKGRAEGRVEAMKIIAKTMLLKHNTINEIIELTGLSKEQIERLK
ncbi:MAG: transposase [Candidatus Tisiphia sp.]|nr:transposase [Candidatus Tisiphia sp.]